MSVPKLERSLYQWRECHPEAMATKQSSTAIMFAFQDARHDVLLLAEQVNLLRAQLTFAADVIDTIAPGNAQVKAMRAAIRSATEVLR